MIIIVIRARFLFENVWQDQVSFAFIEEINDDLPELGVVDEAKIKV